MGRGLLMGPLPAYSLLELVARGGVGASDPSFPAELGPEASLRHHPQKLSGGFAFSRSS
jgi:hypothetical protein